MQAIQTQEAPAPIGPYSQGVVDGDTVYVSGQGPADPESRDVVAGTIEEQTAQVLENVGAVLRAAGTSLDDVAKATVYLTDMDEYDGMNGVYGEYMSDPYPARAAVEVSRLPLEIKVEIEVVASR